MNETEIKLKVDNAELAARLLYQNGFLIHKPRIFERNLIFDTPDQTLRNSARLLRLRDAGGAAKLTFKGPAELGRHKSREEREVAIASFDEMHVILAHLGYEVTFAYDKYRTEYQRPNEEGIATIDETPAGVFMELEGPPDWIDQTAAALGFEEKDYITASYASLYSS
jgi:adenylate cyclase class 2